MASLTDVSWDCSLRNRSAICRKNCQSQGDPIQQPLEEDTDWYRDLVEHSQDLLCVHDLQGRFLSVNPVPARLLGYSVEEVLRMPMRDLIDRQFRSQFDVYLREIERTGESHGLLAVVTRSGEQRIWEYHNRLRAEGVEQPIVRGIARDVTERVRAEKRLGATNEQLVKTAGDQERTLQELTLFRMLLDQSNDAIKVIDPETLRFLDVNQRSCLELGYSREELLSMTVHDIDPNVDETVIARVQRQLRESGFAIMETVHRRKDGTTFPVEVSMRQVRLDREYGVSISRDITERKSTEERLREFEKVVENLEEMIVVVNRDRRYLLANRAALRYRGMSKEQLIGRHVTEVVQPELYEMTVKGKLDESFAGHIVNDESQSEYPGLGVRDIACTYLPIEGSTGIDRVACVLRDVTERKQAEEALRTSEREQHKIAEQLETERARLIEAQAVAKVGSWETELPSLDITWSEQTHRIFETDPSTFHPSRPGFVELVHPEDRAKVDAAYEASLEKGAPSTVEYRIVVADGRVKVLEEHWKVFQDGQGRPARLVGTCLDISERKRAAAMLQESELRFRTVYERSPVGIALLDSDTGRFLQVNPKFCEIVGREENDLLGIDVASITHPDDTAQGAEYQRQMAKENLTSYEMEKRYVRPDGSVRWVRVLVVPMWNKGDAQRWQMGLVQDVTERRRSEESIATLVQEVCEAK